MRMSVPFRSEGFFGIIEYSNKHGLFVEIVSKYSSQQAYDTEKACLKNTQARAEHLEKRMEASIVKAVVIKGAPMIQWDASTEVVVPPLQP